MDQNDLPIEVVLHRIGPCPICGKGQMLQGSAGWTCDYFKSIEDKCTFTIFSSYSGYLLNEEDAVALIKDGRTMKHNFVTQSGKGFVARLVLEDGKVKVVGENRTLSVRCPNCGGKVKETQKGYACENFFSEDDKKCLLYIPKAVCERFISEAEVLEVLEKGRTEVLDGFYTQDREFSAFLALHEDGAVKLQGDICKCPKCGGTLYCGSKGFTCSNYSNPSVQCRFVIWRNISGHVMTIDEVRTLCRQKSTPVLIFRTVEGVEYSGRLVINNQWQVKRS